MNRWKLVAIILMILVALELIWIYAHWSLISAAWKNRATIEAAGNVVAGVQSVTALAGEAKSLFGGIF